MGVAKEERKAEREKERGSLFFFYVIFAETNEFAGVGE